MRPSSRIACLFTFVSAIACAVLAAQTPAVLTVSPDKATLLVGGSQTFRAVGRDGRIRHNVHWSVSPIYAATLTQQGDEVLVTASEAAPSVVLTAVTDGDSADATIEIRGEKNMTPGTVLWSVNPIPGCKVTNMTQAVPSANGPDLYVQEQCGDGQYIRALTHDGRELWRRPFGTGQVPAKQAEPISSGALIGFIPNGVPSSKPAARGPAKPQEKPGEHINSRAVSVCDAIAAGMTRDEVEKALSVRGLHLPEKQRAGTEWTVEEESFRCTISFDGAGGTVFKKKKTIVTD